MLGLYLCSLITTSLTVINLLFGEQFAFKHNTVVCKSLGSLMIQKINAETISDPQPELCLSNCDKLQDEKDVGGWDQVWEME